jgi:hypothetical protein
MLQRKNHMLVHVLSKKPSDNGNLWRSLMDKIHRRECALSQQSYLRLIMVESHYRLTDYERGRLTEKWGHCKKRQEDKTQCQVPIFCLYALKCPLPCLAPLPSKPAVESSPLSLPNPSCVSYEICRLDHWFHVPRNNLFQNISISSVPPSLSSSN